MKRWLLLLLLATPCEAGVYKVWPNLINDTVTVQTSFNYVSSPGSMAYTAESTAVINVGDYDNLAMVLQVIPAEGDTSELTRTTLVVEVRAHTALSSDSSSTFYLQPINVSGNAAQPDTVDNVYDSQGFPPCDISDIDCGALYGAWEGEMHIDLLGARGRGNMKSNQFFGSPNGLYVPLSRRIPAAGQLGSGVPVFSAPYMSVRVRCIRGVNKPRIILSITGVRHEDD